MNIKVLFFILVASNIVADSEATPENAKQILKLHSKNFKTTKNSIDYLIVLMHETECSFCKNVIDIFVQLIPEYAEKYPNLRFATVDVEENETVKEVENVQSIPELRLYLNGDIFALYTDSFDKKKFDSYVQDILDETKTAKLIKTEKDYQIFKNTEIAVFFGLPEVTERNTLYCNNIARMFPSLPIFWAETHGKFDSRIVNDEDEEFLYHFKFKRTLDDGDKEFKVKEGFDSAGIVHWIMKLQKPTVQTMNPKLLSAIMNEGVRGMIIYDRTLSSPLINRFELGALKANYSAIFVKATLDDSNAQVLAKVLGIEEGEFPVLRAIQAVDGRYKKYKFEGEFTQKNINNFIYDFGENQLEEYYKSGKYVNNFGKEFSRFNRKQFNKVINQGQKDVFVGYIGKWCPDCSGVQTVLVDVNKKMKLNRETVILAIIDTDENDIEGVLKQQLPSIQLYKRRQARNPILFTDKFTAENVIKFLEKELDRKFAGEDEDEEEEEEIMNDSKEIQDQLEEIVEAETGL